MAHDLTPAESFLIRAAMYDLLALGYAYPDAQQVPRMHRVCANLQHWLAEDFPVAYRPTLQLCASLAAVPARGREVEWNRLFSGAMAAPPYETAYEPDIFRKQHALADIAGFYRAFGFQVPAGSRWQPDHMGVELEFCSIVLQRAAHAAEQGWQDHVATCTDALAKFLLEHLGRWASAFAADLEQAARLDVYRDLARLTRDWIEAELAALGLEPDRLRSRQPDDAAPPSCGGCTLACGPGGVPPGYPISSLPS